MNNYNFKDLITRHYFVYLSGWKHLSRWDNSNVLLKDSHYDEEPYLSTNYLYIEVLPFHKNCSIKLRDDGNIQSIECNTKPKMCPMKTHRGVFRKGCLK